MSNFSVEEAKKEIRSLGPEDSLNSAKLHEVDDNLSRDERVELYSYTLEELTDEGASKKDQIIVLLRVFGNLSSRIISMAVGCSKDYASRFWWQAGDPFSSEEDKVVWNGNQGYIIYTQKYRNNDPDKSKKEMVKKRDGRKCVRCGNDDDLVIHHITPAKFGSSDSENLATLCRDCHNMVHKTGSMHDITIYNGKEDFWLWANNPEKYRLKELIKHLDGVGDATIDRLYNEFGSVEAVLEAGVDGVAGTPYVTRKVSRRIIASLSQRLNH